MRRTALTAAVIAVLVAAAGTAAAASPGPGAASSGSTTLVFQVVFSPFEFVQANNVRNPKSPIALGDEIVAHDQLFSHGQHVGDDAVSFVIVSAPPNAVLANGTGVFRIPGGTIAFQTTAVPGPAPGQLAVTGGTGAYGNVGGDGTLVEFGNGKGKLTLHLLSLVARGAGA